MSLSMTRAIAKRALAAMLVAPIFFGALPAFGQDTASSIEAASEQTALEMRSEQIVLFFNGEIEAEDVFTEGFLAAVPTELLVATVDQWTAEHGAAMSVEGLNPVNDTRAGLDIRMERAVARGGIAIDPTDENRVSELVFRTFDTIDDSADKISASLADLPGDVSVWFGPLDGGAPTISVNSDAQMPLGSTFKLYVLAALARDVAQGERSWDDVVTLDVTSFPSGMMQDWPQGSPVTLQTLASLMISISDNTATDQLIAVLGREAVFQTLVESGHSDPARNNPFMTTRELFLLKGGPSARLDTYAGGDADLRAEILAQIEDTPVTLSEIGGAFADGPKAINVEWFGNSGDLVNLFRFMRETADPLAFDIMGINPSMLPATRELWAYSGYKGGSEPGVLNLTWLLTDDDGRDYALVMSWSNPDANLAPNILEGIAQRIQNLSQ